MVYLGVDFPHSLCWEVLGMKTYVFSLGKLLSLNLEFTFTFSVSVISLFSGYCYLKVSLWFPELSNLSLFLSYMLGHTLNFIFQIYSI